MTVHRAVSQISEKTSAKKAMWAAAWVGAWASAMAGVVGEGREREGRVRHADMSRMRVASRSGMI